MEGLHAALMAVVPVSYAIAALSLPLLFAVSMLSGGLGGLGGITSVAVRAAVSRVVPAAQLVPANSAVSAIWSWHRWPWGGTLVVQNGSAVLAVLTASRVTRWIGLYRLVPIFAPVTAAALFLIPAAALLPPLIALVAYSVLFGYCTTLWSIGSASLQQTLVPPWQIGRVTALSRTVGLVAIPVGAMIGGITAEHRRIVQTQLLFAFVALACTTTAACGAWRARPRPRHPISTTLP